MTDVMTRCYSTSGVHNGYVTVHWGGRGYQSYINASDAPLTVSGIQLSDMLPVSGYQQMTGSGVYRADRNSYLDIRFDNPTYYG